MFEIEDKAIDAFYGTYERPERWNLKKCWDEEKEEDEEWPYQSTDS